MDTEYIEALIRAQELRPPTPNPGGATPRSSTSATTTPRSNSLDEPISPGPANFGSPDVRATRVPRAVPPRARSQTTPALSQLPSSIGHFVTSLWGSWRTAGANGPSKSASTGSLHPPPPPSSSVTGPDEATASAAPAAAAVGENAPSADPDEEHVFSEHGSEMGDTVVVPRPNPPLDLARHPSVAESLAQDTGIALLGRHDDSRPLLTPDMAHVLRPHLPPLQRLAEAWHLVYSTDQHGISLHTLYNRIEACVSKNHVLSRGFVLVILDSNDKLFGAYLSDPLMVHPTFYGTGESFVFEFDHASKELQTYHWTGLNDFFLLGEPSYFAVGAGDGKFAIYLDSNLEHGKSNPTETFDNPVLASNTTFMCLDCEVWGMAE
ncbi:hypothetical protein AMAG_12543 [Allomyces macrogynus ATCC 38327]|uniref:Oxidation resistance protein 1 n=1 Tax=Allomyces macrogynus (strain ATCC 38327) TaxID=578462 RepID=A0A0L0SZ99_ALLM3|nr:hypothetical protein AMAG_12543 [Allomyces macrogynus ATCC 38327]|eukprot:KNE67826.1 hypothetical protein AMAG_12543 [Allomyces macrogynus ATCC 38327]